MPRQPPNNNDNTDNLDSWNSSELTASAWWHKQPPLAYRSDPQFRPLVKYGYLTTSRGSVICENTEHAYLISNNLLKAGSFAAPFVSTEPFMIVDPLPAGKLLYEAKKAAINRGTGTPEEKVKAVKGLIDTSCPLTIILLTS